jgi:mucolipin 3
VANVVGHYIMEELDDYSQLGNGDDVLDQLDRLKARLSYFFMDPVEKWRHKQTRPWKLLVQILKIILFTSQLVVFGQDMAKFINYKEEMQMTLKQLLLRDWDPSADAIAYPGPYVPYAVYTKPDFIQTVNYALRIYSNITHAGVGQYGYQSNSSDTVSPIGLCVTKYMQADFDPSAFKYNYSMYTVEECVAIAQYAPPGSDKWQQIDFRSFLKEPFEFQSLVSLRLDLPLRTILMEDATTGYAEIVCFDLDTVILFDNRHRIGQIIISLTGIPKMVGCQGQVIESAQGALNSRCTLNLIVIAFCVISFTLCCRSLYRALGLLRTTEYILRSHAKRLVWPDRFEFFDFWLVSIIINDLMVGFATVIMTFYNGRLLETNNYTLCSLLLGLGNLLSWSGLLRYLSFFKKYNLLIVTLRKSFMHVLRFMLCTTLIYW